MLSVKLPTIQKKERKKQPLFGCLVSSGLVHALTTVYRLVQALATTPPSGALGIRCGVEAGSIMIDVEYRWLTKLA